jgi:hypothetical protein
MRKKHPTSTHFMQVEAAELREISYEQRCKRSKRTSTRLDVFTVHAFIFAV